MPSPRRARQRLLVSVRRDHRWAAWLEDERVVEFHHEREGEASPLGNIYLGRITRVEKGLGAAFVDIGMKEAAFLPLSEAGTPVVEGAKAIVQIEREGQAGKGPRVTTRASLRRRLSDSAAGASRNLEYRNASSTRTSGRGCRPS